MVVRNRFKASIIVFIILFCSCSVNPPIYKVHKPVFSLPSGFYNQSITLSISSSTDNSIIYYSAVGTKPMSTSQYVTYTKELLINETTIIKAKAYHDGMEESEESIAYFVVNEKKIKTFDNAGAWFGTKLAMSYDGNMVVANAYSGEPRVNAIYLYSFNNSFSPKKIIPEVNDQVENFSKSIAISKDSSTLFIGAGYTCLPGCVYIYKRLDENWSSYSYIKMFPSNSAVSDYFGEQIAVDSSNKTLVVTNSGPYKSGEIFIFERNGEDWSNRTEYRLPGYAYFVCISGAGDIIATSDFASRRISIFERNGTDWSSGYSLFTFTRSLSPLCDYGWNIHMAEDGNTIVVAELDDQYETGSYQSGAIYIYEKSGTHWDSFTTTKIKASDNDPGDLFGAGLAIAADGNTILVGAPVFGNLFYGPLPFGMAYKYIKAGTNWSNYIEKEFCSYDIDYMDDYGRTVAISGDGKKYVVGAPNGDTYYNVPIGSIYCYDQE